MFVTLSLLLVAVCLVPAAAKLAGHPKMRHAAAHFGIAWRRYRLIGVAELAAAVGVLVGFLWRPAGLLAAAGMTLLLIGAVVTHRRAHDNVREALPALLALAVSGTYLVVAQ
ncbi:MAG TPA: DoxX family protein [Pilimelia sp.]|nr:DoxX family protein [Pilimelia sp.]